jgi:hypothetical protein
MTVNNVHILFPLSDNNSPWNFTSAKALTASCTREPALHGGNRNTSITVKQIRVFSPRFSAAAIAAAAAATTRLDISVGSRIKSFVKLLFVSPIEHVMLLLLLLLLLLLYFIKYIETDFVNFAR